MDTLIRSLLPFVLLIAGNAALYSAQAERPGLDKTPPARFTRTEDSHRATLLLFERRAMMNLRVVPEGPVAPLPTTRRLEILRPLLEQAFKEHERKPEYILTVAEYPELKARIALAAACSGKWNMTSGKPKTGAASVFLKDLLGNQKLYPELESFFGSLGYAVAVSSVEEVTLCRWKDIKPETSAPCRPELHPTSQAPCGASIVFRITKLK